jgi:hypothetical protein
VVCVGKPVLTEVDAPPGYGMVAVEETPRLPMDVLTG